MISPAEEKVLGLRKGKEYELEQAKKEIEAMRKRGMGHIWQRIIN